MSSPAPAPPVDGRSLNYGLLALAMACSLPGLFLRLQGFDPHASPVMGMLVFGLAIVSAATVLTWAAEVAQLDIGSGLAIVFLALVTVLPEYAVDLYFAWTAATNPANGPLALANMTGANRLLVGVGWPVLALVAWRRFGTPGIQLGTDRSNDVFWLGAATLYSLIIPLKGTLAWYDALILFTCYALYVVGSKNEPEEHADLVGPPRVLARWPRRQRGVLTVLFFAWSAGVILASSEPFAESLVHGGTILGIDEYLLVQWLAPLASESPEFIVVVLLTLRGRAALGLGALLSSKVNHWTLLIGGIPVAFAISNLVAGQGLHPSMAIDERQVSELWLTATQGLYGTAVLADLRLTLRQALIILGLFLLQFIGTIVVEEVVGIAAVDPFHDVLSVVYALLAAERLWSQREHVRERVAQGLATLRRRHRGAEAG